MRLLQKVQRASYCERCSNILAPSITTFSVPSVRINVLEKKKKVIPNSLGHSFYIYTMYTRGSSRNYFNRFICIRRCTRVKVEYAAPLKMYVHLHSVYLIICEYNPAKCHPNLIRRAFIADACGLINLDVVNKICHSRSF